MSGVAIDLSAIARVRRAFETIVATHPRLAHLDAHARMSRWIYAPENDAPMSRPIDPDSADAIQLALRITKALAAALDAEVARFNEANPGASASRAMVARIALTRAFLPSGNVLASASAPAPVAPVAPAAPAPVARVERVERASPAAPPVASVPAVDPRQGHLPITATVANDAPMSESTHAHAALHARYHDARERLRFTHEDAERALAAAGVPVENLRRELAKPTAKWTAAHAAALTAWLDTIEASGVPSPSEPAAAATPKRTRDDDALRVRYRAALAAKQLVGTHTAARVGCSEASLRGWAIGSTKNLRSEWLDALVPILDALDAKEVPA